MSEEERQILNQAEHLPDLLRSPGWKTFSSLLQTMLEHKTLEALRDIEHIGDILSNERAKGAVLTIKTILALPSAIIADAEIIRKDYLRSPDGADS